MNGMIVEGGVEIGELVVRQLTPGEKREQREQLWRSYQIKGWLRMPVWPARAIIGPYGIRWERLK